MRYDWSDDSTWQAETLHRHDAGSHLHSLNSEMPDWFWNTFPNWSESTWIIILSALGTIEKDVGAEIKAKRHYACREKWELQCCCWLKSGCFVAVCTVIINSHEIDVVFIYRSCGVGLFGSLLQEIASHYLHPGVCYSFLSYFCQLFFPSVSSTLRAQKLSEAEVMTYQPELSTAVHTSRTPGRTITSTHTQTHLSIKLTRELAL